VNYRHAFHAGNFADVLKHVILVRVLLHLRDKESAFRVIETHAGAGRYDLQSDAATRTGEWREGIGRLLAKSIGHQADEIIAPYLAIVRGPNAGANLRSYPGSPAIALALSRSQDRLVFHERHPEEYAALSALLGSGSRFRAVEDDGWTALKAELPPPERRGLLLMDPPFEEPGEYGRLAAGLAEAHRRWATGIYLLWYPIKDKREAETFARRVAKLGIPKILRAELAVGTPAADAPLAACGVLAVNPPWPLEGNLKTLLPALASALGQNQSRTYRLEWLVP
jgi:23S rRNA (adenine2030-N6)-methyltransferase